MKTIKRFLFYLILSCFLCTIFSCPAYANETDIVVIYDISGSMKSVDPENQAPDILRLILDIIPGRDHYPVKVAMIPFSTNAEVLKREYQSDWWYFADTNDGARGELKDAIDYLSYNGQNTDIEKALSQCKKVLEQMKADESDSTRIVAFMTDGYMDLPSDTEKNNKFEKMAESYDRLMELSKTFPSDCYFLAIFPEVNTTNSEDIGWENGKVIRYFNEPVPEEYQEKMTAVINGTEEFFNQLTQRQAKKIMYKSRVEKVDWRDKDVLNQLGKDFKDFVNEIFGSYGVSREAVNLQDEYKFMVSQMIKEVDITIIPDSSSIKERRDKVKLLEENGIELLYKGKKQDYAISSSRSAITLKIIDPLPGLYSIKSERVQFTCSLMFSSYGTLTIEGEDIPQSGVLGEKITLKGRIVDEEGTPIAAEEMINTHLWLKNQDSNEKEQIDLTSEGSFSYEYTLAAIGEHHMAYEIAYNDTGQSNSSGVSNFVETMELPSIIVPEVNYRCGSKNKETYAEEATILEIEPYSIQDNEEKEVLADACKTYLQDHWIVRLPGNDEREAELSSDKRRYVVTCSFPSEGKYTLDWENTRTGRLLQQEIEIKSRPMHLSNSILEEVKIPCSLIGVCQTGPIDAAGWIQATDLKPYTIHIDDGKLFEASPKELSSGNDMLVCFKRKSQVPIHWFQSENLAVFVKDHSGRVCLKTEILVREEPTLYVKASLGIAALIFVVLLLAALLRGRNSVEIRIYIAGKHTKKVKIQSKEGATKKCKIRGETLEIYYSARQLRYRYKGHSGIVDNYTIRI